MHLKAAIPWRNPGTYAGMARDLSTLFDDFKPGMGGLDCFCTWIAFGENVIGTETSHGIFEVLLFCDRARAYKPPSIKIIVVTVLVKERTTKLSGVFTLF